MFGGCKYIVMKLACYNIKLNNDLLTTCLVERSFFWFYFYMYMNKSIFLNIDLTLASTGLSVYIILTFYEKIRCHILS